MHDTPNTKGGSRCAICGDMSVRSVLPTTLVIIRPIMGIPTSHEMDTVPLCLDCFNALYGVEDVTMAIAHIIPERCP